jgi:hypothetical protein
VSLAAEIDGLVVGFVIGRVYHGEYGHMDTFAVDTFLPSGSLCSLSRAA